MQFEHRVVVITGASSGIGAACTLEFATRAADLALVGRNVENLENVAKQCEDITGKKPLTIIADISIEDDVTRIITDTVDHYGKIDVLVNNAGILILAGVLDDIASFDQMLATNVRGTYLMTQKAIPHLLETKGNIVNISSVLSKQPIPAMMPYCMTKAAIDMLTKCVALDLAPRGVRVNSINPGPVNTNLFTRNGVSEDVNDKMYAGMEAAMPLRKLAKSADVAKLACFLASDDASCITGSCHQIDCGLHLGDPAIKA
ncbi:3-oxoacyl-[acyl-carrier-protein] reductase FabG-like [Aricia agestis]|uniref:3-oxoacyl-[acyl-carrier-protein] reductase FabG-like n=1 Tax=Aricia agestis TaxID=91739 RepID=UPI001C20A63B|nr:3-oxoacyl-[acyl-carrier-protein] reductase FabG-like [Aricia agestis]